MGLRRPENRRLLAQVRLDQDRPARPGRGPLHPPMTRPSPSTGPTADGGSSGKPRPWHPPPNAPCAPSVDEGPDLGAPSSRRSPTRFPQPVGSLVPRHPHRDHPPGDHRAHRGQARRRSLPPPHAHLLPPPSPRRHRSQYGTLTQNLPAHAGCFSPVPRQVARRVVRGRVSSNAPPLPDPRRAGPRPSGPRRRPGRTGRGRCGA